MGSYCGADGVDDWDKERWEEEISKHQVIPRINFGDPPPYLIFVTGTTGAARVKNSVRCKFFQFERKKITYFLVLG